MNHSRFAYPQTPHTKKCSTMLFNVNTSISQGSLPFQPTPCSWPISARTRTHLEPGLFRRVMLWMFMIHLMVHQPYGRRPTPYIEGAESGLGISRAHNPIQLCSTSVKDKKPAVVQNASLVQQSSIAQS